MKQPSEFLREAAATFDDRNPQYGDNYIKIGAIMMGLFPNGLKMETADDWNRMHLILLKVVKMSRYAENFGRGGHADSAHDDVIYSAMLEAVDAMIAARPKSASGGGSGAFAELTCMAEAFSSNVNSWFSPCLRCGTKVRYGCAKSQLEQRTIKIDQPAGEFHICPGCEHTAMCNKEQHCDRSGNGYR